MTNIKYDLFSEYINITTKCMQHAHLAEEKFLYEEITVNTEL
jgi:hypothetical protein